MRHTKNTLDAAKRGKSIMLLGTALVHAVDLHRQAKQAHWNVGGPAFTALHELFDRIATAADKDADLLAERLVALGGTPMVVLRQCPIARRSACIPLMLARARPTSMRCRPPWPRLAAWHGMPSTRRSIGATKTPRTC